jgi:hypothetical protein
MAQNQNIADFGRPLLWHGRDPDGIEIMALFSKTLDGHCAAL